MGGYFQVNGRFHRPGRFDAAGNAARDGNGNRLAVEKACWHQGFATEAGEGCRQYAFNILKKQKVVSIIRDTNLASRKVAERLGMRPRFSFVKHYYGMDMPHIVYAVTTP